MANWFATNRLHRGSRARGYLAAVLATAATVLLCLGLEAVLEVRAPMLLFTVAVIVSAYGGGLGPGLLATALSACAGGYFFVEPRYGFWPTVTTEQVRVILFVLTGVVISVLSERLRGGGDRQRAEEERRRSAAILAGILEGTSDLVAALDCDFRYLAFNRPYSEQFRRLFGRGIEVGASLAESLEHLPDERRLAMELWGRALQGETFATTHEFGDPNLQRRVFDLRFSPIRDAHGTVIGAAHIVSDVTERQTAEDLLREREEHAHRILDNTVAMIGVLTPDGTLIDANATALRAGNLTREDVVGRKFWDCYWWSYDSQVQQQLREAVIEAAAGRRVRYDVVVRMANESRMPIDFMLAPARNAAGDVTHLIPSALDIADRKRAEGALRESELFFRQTLESIPGMAFTTRADGYCDYQSQQWVDYTGVPMSEHLGAGWKQLLHPDDRSRAYAAWQAAVRGSAPYDLEYRVRRHDGQYEWFKVLGRPIRDSAGQIARWFGVAMNIEDLKRTEEELKAARDSAERAKAAAELANRAKDHFLAVLSHELRTPLTPVVMGVAMLEGRSDLDPPVRETLEMIRRNVEMEAQLIDDLLDMTRIARGKIELRRCPVELCAVIQRAVEVCRPEIEAAMLHFDLDLGPAPPYWVEADPSRLQQVFWNLLKNAVKFTPDGGSVGIRCGPQDSHLLVEVADSGIGIEAEALSRVFDAFEQADRAITRQFGGLGLGLAISKALVEMHGGTIEAHSEGRDKGTTFRIRLPLSAPATPTEEPVPAAAPQRTGRPLHILLVEDHAVTAKMMQMVLTAEGHTVETAPDMATALHLAERHPFDLLLSDLGLPDGSGHDLMRELRVRGHRLPGIALSGYGHDDDVQRSHQAGFAAHLTKPASREAVVEAVASFSVSQAAADSEPNVTGRLGA